MFLKLKFYFLVFGTFLAALVVSWVSGKREAKFEQEQEGLQNYIDTRKRIDEVSEHTSPDAAREWLRKRGE